MGERTTLVAEVEKGATGKAWSDTTSPEERAEYRKRRAAYVEVFGEAVVSQAIEKAANHRNYGKQHGQTEHFTPWQWLGLLREHDFSCPICRAKPDRFEAHHLHPLSQGGANTIQNILPLCHECHHKWHEQQWRYGKDHYDHQLQLCTQFQAGDWVKCHYRRRGIAARTDSTMAFYVAEIVEIRPSEIYTGDLWENAQRTKPDYWELGGRGVFMENKQFFVYTYARAIVRKCRLAASQNYENYADCSDESYHDRTDYGPGRTGCKTVWLQNMERFGMEPWHAEEQALCDQFYEGAMVRFRGAGQWGFEPTLGFQKPVAKEPWVLVRVFPSQANVGPEGRLRVRASAEIYRPANDLSGQKPRVAKVYLTHLAVEDPTAWLAEEKQQYEKFTIGGVVRRWGSPRKRNGVITELIIPEIYPTWNDFSGGQPFGLPTEWIPWREAQAVVKWATAKTPTCEGVAPAVLVSLTKAEIEKFAQANLKKKRID